jgi:hypothetical protein
MIEVLFGVMTWWRGDFGAVGFHLGQVPASEAAADQHEIDAVWFLPDEPIASAYIYLALTRLVRGDLTGAAIAVDKLSIRLALTEAAAIRDITGAVGVCVGR